MNQHLRPLHFAKIFRLTFSHRTRTEPHPSTLGNRAFISIRQLIVSRCLLLFLALASPIHLVLAQATDSTAYSGTNSNSGYNRQSTFGTNSSSGLAQATVTMGANDSQAPFIQFRATTPNATADFAWIDANLVYHWTLSGDPHDSVLVHITSSGWISSDYSYQLNPIGSHNFGPSTPRTAIFDSSSGAGLQTGNLNWWSAARVSRTETFGENSGSSTLYAEFSRTYDLWVHPTFDNGIQLMAYADPDYMHSGGTAGGVTETYSMSGYISSQVTIDSQYGNQYALLTSGIPVVAAVPEPETYAMLLAGLGLIGVIGRRRRAT